MEYFNSAYIIGRIHHTSPYIDGTIHLYEVILNTVLPSGDPGYVAVYFPYSKATRISEMFHEGDLVEITGCIRPGKKSSQILYGYSIHHVNDENFGDYDRSEKNIVYLSGSISSIISTENDLQEIHLLSLYETEADAAPFDFNFFLPKHCNKLDDSFQIGKMVFITGQAYSSLYPSKMLSVFTDRISEIPSSPEGSSFVFRPLNL